jgi:hypothetical protein
MTAAAMFAAGYILGGVSVVVLAAFMVGDDE